MLHRRAHRRGADLRRPHHRRAERHRAGHADRPGHGHPVRHERRPRARSSSADQQGEVFLGKEMGHEVELLRRGGGGDRRRGPPAARRRPRRAARDPRRCTAPRSTGSPTPWWSRRPWATPTSRRSSAELDIPGNRSSVPEALEPTDHAAGSDANGAGTADRTPVRERDGRRARPAARRPDVGPPRFRSHERRHDAAAASTSRS